jgi:hypothetical protein
MLCESARLGQKANGIVDMLQNVTPNHGIKRLRRQVKRIKIPFVNFESFSTRVPNRYRVELLSLDLPSTLPEISQALSIAEPDLQQTARLQIIGMKCP